MQQGSMNVGTICKTTRHHTTRFYERWYYL